MPHRLDGDAIGADDDTYHRQACFLDGPDRPGDISLRDDGGAAGHQRTVPVFSALLAKPESDACPI